MRKFTITMNDGTVHHSKAETCEIFNGDTLSTFNKLDGLSIDMVDEFLLADVRSVTSEGL